MPSEDSLVLALLVRFLFGKTVPVPIFYFSYFNFYFITLEISLSIYLFPAYPGARVLLKENLANKSKFAK